VIGHRLDDVVQWIMLPVGDRAAGWVRSHAQWLGVKHACHLRIGRTALGVRQIVLVRLGRVWLILVREIARD
jgi:hypothetical protein